MLFLMIIPRKLFIRAKVLIYRGCAKQSAPIAGTQKQAGAKTGTKKGCDA